jgi:hypothetical protein
MRVTSSFSTLIKLKTNHFAGIHSPTIRIQRFDTFMDVRHRREAEASSADIPALRSTTSAADKTRIPI